MSPIEAKSIIDALARGIDPATGEVITSDSIFNQPEVIRALFVASKALEKFAQMFLLCWLVYSLGDSMNDDEAKKVIVVDLQMPSLLINNRS